jgi:hypothetical protein
MVSRVICVTRSLSFMAPPAVVSPGTPEAGRIEHDRISGDATSVPLDMLVIADGAHDGV